MLTSPATEILWGGAAGPGKSHGSRVASNVWGLDIPGLQVGLFRREFGDLLKNHVDGPTGFREMLAGLERAGGCRITVSGADKGVTFQNKSKIHFCHCEHEKDVFGYQGAEFHVLILEEATQFTEFQIRYLRSRVRVPDAISLPPKYQGKFPRIIYPTNPGGVGHGYLKRAFWEPAQNLAPFATWQAPDDDGGFVRQFIPARLSDNPSVNPAEYAKRLKGIGSPEYVRALLDGDWSVILGAYFSELAESQHLIPDIIVPPHWLKFAWFDWGYGQPSCCLFFAVSDGDLCWTTDDKEIILPRGALICFREVYMCDPDNPALGARLPNAEQAARILKAQGGDEISAFFSDSKPFQSTGSLSESPAKEFAAAGIPLRLGDTSDRVAAWSMVHSRLQAGPPMLYFCRSCKHTWRTMAALQTNPLKPEDADSDGEDHAPDCVKGACTVRRIVRDRELPTQARLQAMTKRRPTMNDILKARGWPS